MDPRKKARATQQKIRASYDVATKGFLLQQPKKAELRASVPPYDESMVRRIEAKPKGKKRDTKSR